ncbi:MAG: tetratricopeptide repeat protein [Deltaproteobacteria bacterium]|nr:tetratricopeptide repeat protein [Deltaproteobacteria bacterium]
MEEKGDIEGAVRQYAILCEGAEKYERACYDQCRALFDTSHVDTALACATSFVKNHPDSGLAPVAVRMVSTTLRGQEAYLMGAAMLHQLAQSVEGRDVWDSIQYERARLFRYAAMKAEEEAVLASIVDLGRWGSQLWDNAIWRMIAIQQDKEDDSKEEELLLRLLSAKEKSALIASYNSPYFDDALYRLGELYEERNDLQQAYDAFLRLSTWKTSRRRDDALLKCALLKRRTGDGERACMHLKLLTQRMPGSGSIRKAKKLLKEWNCS